MWQVQMDVMNACLDEGAASRPLPDRYQMPNPLMLSYRTQDGRFIYLQMLSPDRFWPDLCRVLGQPAMATDPRFANLEARRQNSRTCIEWLDGIFAARTFAEWRRILADFPGEWVPSVRPGELADDPQVQANDYFSHMHFDDFDLPVVTPPVRFEGQPAQPVRAPEFGEHTEEVLIEMGLSWDDLSALKDDKAIL
jgi:crotonobetainyl-CoA:carnitine CoA-transferase CaiB-like acyl-CoA transferase